MKSKMTNSEHIEGYLYQHDLVMKKVQNQKSPNFNKDYITGSIDVATDEAGMNVINVHFTYVAEFTKSGARNKTYSTLHQIIEDCKPWVVYGKDAATRLKIDTTLDLNDFYNQDNVLVSAKRNEGGFVTIVDELSDEGARNTFSMDMLINGIREVEVDEEKGITDPYIMLHGAVFNYKNDILPVDFVVRNAQGIKYFENLGISNAEPVFTKVWGKIMSTTSVSTTQEESAFGEAAIKTYEKKTKEWVITGTAKVPYEYGDEETITADDINKALQNREIHLADVKKQKEEYDASRAAAATTNKGTSFADNFMNIPADNGTILQVKQGEYMF